MNTLEQWNLHNKILLEMEQEYEMMPSLFLKKKIDLCKKKIEQLKEYIKK